MAVKPPRPRGPHLNAMRCFEAAARLGGFAAAADELSVTPGAISQQVKSLEDWVGAPLFERRSQGVALTALGRSVVDDFTDAFDALGGALHNLRNRAPDAPINIAALPCVAQLWLSPRLPAVRAAFPKQTVSITALETPPNLSRDLFDLSLFIGTPTGEPAEKVIAEDVIFPVCAPELAANIRTPADVLSCPFISDAAWRGDWALWGNYVGLPESDVTAGATFSLYSLALDAARSGAGVIMAHSCLVEGDLASGRLVAPLDGTVPTGQSLILRSPAPITEGSRLAQVIAALL